VGVSVIKIVILKPLIDPIERFLAMLRFEQREKLAQYLLICPTDCRETVRIPPPYQ
jgi:hypothetical protein